MRSAIQTPTWLEARALSALALALLLAACGGGGDNASTTPSPTPAPSTGGAIPTENAATPTPEAPRVSEGAAVLLSVGESLQPACCGLGRTAEAGFQTYLTQKLNRPVELVPLTGDVTTTQFIAGTDGVPSLLDRATTAITQYQRDGHPIAAVLLSIGVKDFDQLIASCGESCDSELRDFQQRNTEQLGVIHSRLNQALDKPAPIFQETYYNAQACAAPGARPPSVAVDISPLNSVIKAAAPENSDFVIDVASAVFAGDCTADGRLTPDAQSRLEAAFRAAYDALPAEYRTQ